jgi:endonuclease YncB( thermonuclease family)
MPQGILEVSGSIELSQFWPLGDSDADTTKIVLTTTTESFRFRPHPGVPFQVTHAFENAIVGGRVRRRPIDNRGRVTIRLQGIDAPELHYRPAAAIGTNQRTATQDALYKEWNHEYRQHLAETGTMQIHKLLARAGRDPLPCKVVTAVDTPGEVFDTYARFVGDVLVEIEGREKNMNTWLVKRGWAMPTFYSSMSAEEIETFMVAAKKARKRDDGVWPYLSKKVGKFDWDLLYRGKGAVPDPVADAGPVFPPKLFRRLATWAVNQRAKMVTGDFVSYLRAHPDHCFLTSDFLTNGPTVATPRRLDEFILPKDVFKLRPEDLIFQEAASKLVGPDGSEVGW